ncbi:hypothetical protein BH23ACT10_BH23ACT10_20880 [soil metagenome]
MTTAEAPVVDVEALRANVRDKYRAVATAPDEEFHFHTGKPHALRLGYPEDLVDGVPDSAGVSFAGIANPFSLGEVPLGVNVVDVGAGAGFDSFVAAQYVGSEGSVVGVDMTPEMLSRARAAAADHGFDNVEFREGFAEGLPVDDGWADVVISNGVINLVADKKAAFAEIWRVLRDGGLVQFADIANGEPIPEGAVRDIDLWTA